MPRSLPRPPRIAPATAAAFRRRLAAWFRREGRDLPWRRTRDPYRILVSELMLQQTQVSRVLDFYARFLDRFPTLGHLAAAPPRRVMESWAGLGYYARARNLHALSRHVHATRDGVLPADEVVEVGEAPVKLKNGRQARVTMHVLEGSKEDIEKQLNTSLQSFFDIYPEI